MATITGNNLANTLNGTRANDTIRGLGGNDILRGFAGDDLLDGARGSDQMFGGVGWDQYLVDSTLDQVIEKRGEGHDMIRSTVSMVLPANVEGLVLLGRAIRGEGNDLVNSIVGNERANVLLAHGGVFDVISGNGGNDVIDGGNGPDSIDGGNGNDRIQGGSGNDRIQGNNGSDLLHGGSGSDVMAGDFGADRMFGGAGNDVYILENALDRVSERPGEGIDFVQTFTGHTLAANFENLQIGGGNTNGTGNAAANGIWGTDGNNTLSGLAGNDRLTGAGGEDLLIGGLGADTLRGGGGADVFKVNASSESAGSAVDIIIDFRRPDGDKIDVSAIDADELLPGNSAFVFAGETATPATGQIGIFVSGGQKFVGGNTDVDADLEFLLRVNVANVESDFVL